MLSAPKLLGVTPRFDKQIAYEQKEQELQQLPTLPSPDSVNSMRFASRAM